MDTQIEPWIFYAQSTYRKMVETTGSMIERLLPKHIHATTPRGFELKIACLSWPLPSMPLGSNSG